MPVFFYKARDRYGTLLTGTIEMQSEAAVAAQLDSLGYHPVLVQKQRSGGLAAAWLKQIKDRLQPIRLEDLTVFTRQLGTLVAAGVSFASSFEALIEQTDHPRLKAIIEQVRKDVESGVSLADALSKHPAVFNELYTSMVRAGELSGNLDTMLDRLAFLLEHEAEVRARIKAATRYPKIVVLALVAAFVVLVTFVIPRFAAMYANFNAPLPLPTRILIGLNDLVQQYGLLLLAAMIAAAAGVRRYIRTTAGRLNWDRLKLKLPVFGPLFLKAALSRFATVFAVLNRSGLPMLQTLDVVSRTVHNVVIAGVIRHIRDGVRQGRGLEATMRVSGMFPSVVLQMVAVGEETGRLDEMLLKVSEYYDRDVKYTIQNLSTTLEPILLVVIGGVILFLALAIFLPWWNLIQVMRGGG